MEINLTEIVIAIIGLLFCFIDNQAVPAGQRKHVRIPI